MRPLVINQARLYLREPANVFFGLAFPSIILLGVGLLIPGMQENVVVDGVDTGVRPVDVYLPVVLAMAIATSAITILPPVFGGYREKGILRRLSTTPMPASRLLVAEIVVNGVSLVVGSVIALVAAWAVFGVAAPARPGVVAAAFALGAVTMMALGCLVAALVPTAGAANATAMSIFFPMLLFAGVWTPGPVMPAGLKAVATWVPLGAVSQALTEGWAGDGSVWLQFAIMGGWTALLVPLAARWFRWS